MVRPQTEAASFHPLREKPDAGQGLSGFVQKLDLPLGILFQMIAELPFEYRPDEDDGKGL
jgi:hypothetical protein